MESLATALITLAVGTWVGAIIFQSAVVAPAVFADLDVESARRFLRTLFPRFYRLGLICGALILLGVATVAILAGGSERLAVVGIAALIMFVLEAISLWMVPRLNAARDLGDAGRSRFERLHRISVALTVAILIIGIALLSVIGANTVIAPGA